MRTDRDPDPVHQLDPEPDPEPETTETGTTARKPVGIMRIVTRTVRRFIDLRLLDSAAALTYYAVLSIFPGLLVLVAGLGLLGDATTESLIDYLTKLAPGSVGQILTDGITNLQAARSSAGILALVGIGAALWSASGYIGAFIRASNAIYAVPEGRPIWLVWPLRLALTLVVGVLLVIGVVLLVVTGKLATAVGDLVGFGGTFVTVWSYARWPALLLLVSLIFAILYWAAPNAKVKLRWISAGGLLAVLVWIAASAGFGLYAANFGSYNRTYGALGGVIVFLIWLWISNIAVLLGAQFDAELKRAKAEAAGHPSGEEPFMTLRDTRKIEAGENRRL